MKFSLRLLYLYLFSAIGLFVTVIGTIGIIDLNLKTYVFKVEDTYYPEPTVVEGQAKLSEEEMAARNKERAVNQRKRQLSNNLAMIIVGVPLYLYHWTTIKRGSKA